MTAPVTQPQARSGRWADLLPRTLSALVMLGVGGVSIHLGGPVFAGFVALLIGAVVWETLRMFRRDAALAALGVGAASAVAVFLATLLPLALVPLVLALPVGLGAMSLETRRRKFAVVAAWVLLAGFGLIWLRDSYWVGWIFWLILVVVATDVAGYFCGKYFGGPKLWPAVSPKKTWSGTSGGWFAAALTGLGFVLFASMPVHLIWISVLVAMASQAGDIAESALKRQMEVKDSSQLIPGHGGVFDRFDGMLGAGVLCFLVAILLG